MLLNDQRKKNLPAHQCELMFLRLLHHKTSPRRKPRRRRAERRQPRVAFNLFMFAYRRWTGRDAMPQLLWQKRQEIGSDWRRSINHKLAIVRVVDFIPTLLQQGFAFKTNKSRSCGRRRLMWGILAHFSSFSPCLRVFIKWNILSSMPLLRDFH